MPFINMNDDEKMPPVYKRQGRKRTIPRHVIREWARDDVMQGRPCFSCPECHTNYGLRFGREAKKGSFGERTLYCLDCIDSNKEIHKL